jgi:hypothetical protein
MFVVAMMLKCNDPPKRNTCAFFFELLSSKEYFHSIDASSLSGLLGSFFGPSFIFAKACFITISAIVSYGSNSLIKADMTLWVFSVGQFLSLRFLTLSLLINDTWVNNNANCIMAF